MSSSKFKKHQVAIFAAGPKFAVVAFSVTDEVNAIGVHDPLQPFNRFFSYETEPQAAKMFAGIVQETIQNGTHLV